MPNIIGKLNRELTLARVRMRKESLAHNSEMVQWGIVGTGYMAETMARALGMSGTSNVRAVLSRSQDKAKRFAKRHGALTHYSDLRSFIANEYGHLDVVYIATPVETHAAYIEPLLMGGYNVMCEKPLTCSYEDTERLERTADEQDLVLFEGMWSYYLPTYLQAKKWLDEGSIGKLLSVDVKLCKQEPHKQESVLLDYGVYALAFASYFVDTPLDVDVDACKRFENGWDAEWVLRMQSRGGVNVCCEISALKADVNEAVLHGERGTITFCGQFNRSNEIILKDVKDCIVSKKTFDYSSSGFEHEIAAVEKAVLESGVADWNQAKTVATALLMSQVFEAGKYDAAL